MRIITFLLGGICHQLGERCLVYDGLALPLCARCMGTFLGMALALLVLRLVEPGRPSRLPAWPVLTLFGVLAALWALDGVNSLFTLLRDSAPLYEPSNVLRLVSGVGLGLGLGVLLYPIYHEVMWRETDARRVLAHGWQLAALLGAGGLLVSAVLIWRAAPFGLWLALICLAVLTALALANAALLVLLLRREGRGERWTQVAPYVALGALMALTEMTTVALLRGWLLR